MGLTSETIMARWRALSVGLFLENEIRNYGMAQTLEHDHSVDHQHW